VVRVSGTHSSNKKPNLIATAPNQVCSWDITKLQSPQCGIYYQLYAIVDVYSRCVVG
jgi:putative transposase